MYANVNGVSNTAVGHGTLFSTTTNNSTALGYYAIGNNITGDANTAIGYMAMYNGSSGFQNCAFGYQSLYNTNSNYNTAFGTQTLLNNISGINNVAIGGFAGYSRDGLVSCSFIGYGADASSNSLSNSTAIGAGAVVNASNKIRLGNGSVTVIEGNVGYTVSDSRFKNDVEENIPGLSFITQLRPVSYRYQAYEIDKFLLQNNKEQQSRLKKEDYADAEKMVHMGFIAQEVEKLMKEKKYQFSIVHSPD